jgi:hypothetical protein
VEFHARVVVEGALGDIQDPRAVDPVIAALQDTDFHVRVVAAFVLGKIGDGRAAGPLTAALDDPEPAVRRSASAALEKIKNPPAAVANPAAPQNVEARTAPNPQPGADFHSAVKTGELEKVKALGAWMLVKSTYSGPLSVDVVGGGLALKGPEVPVERSIVYETVGEDTVRVTVDGIIVNGQAVDAHYVWTGKFDGADYPVSGDPKADTRSYKQVNENTYELTIKKDGKVIPFGQIVVSFNGKTSKISTGGNTAVYRKQ